MITLNATVAIAAQNHIGEGPVWDAASRRLLWVDHAGQVVHEARDDGHGSWKESRRWAAGCTVSAALPRARGGLLISGGNEIFLLDDAGRRTSFACLDFDPVLCRLNDVKCDALGRLWAGTLTRDFSPRAALYRIDPDGTVARVLQNVSLANGFDWSPDRSTFYFIDSIRCSVDAFDCDLERGMLTNRRVVVAIDATQGVPNGMTVDVDGGLWVALTGGGRVCRFAPDGTLLARVNVSVPGATSCAFGGPDGSDLFITSRTGRVPEVIGALGLPEKMMESRGPEAGALFVCRPGVAGAPATPFAG
jgi:sugar lactone lactonase YvrE